MKILTYLHGYLDALVCTADDVNEVRAQKILVFCGMASMASFTALAVAGFAAVSAWWLVGFIGCLSPVLFVGLWALLVKKNLALGRTILNFSIALGTVGMQWILGSQVSGVINCAFLGPQIAITCGASFREGCLSFGACCIGHIVLSIIACTIGADALTPNHFILPQFVVVIVEVSSILSPWLISFLLAHFILRRLLEFQKTLQESLAEAERLAQKIVNFDLDDIDDKTSQKTGSDIVDVLLNVASNMKLYRPYLPAHLLQHAHVLETICTRDDYRSLPHSMCKSLESVQSLSDDESVTSTSSRSFNHKASFSQNPRGSSLGPSSGHHSTENTKYRTSKTQITGQYENGRHKTPATVFEVPQHWQAGTLLFVELHNLEIAVDNAGHLDGPKVLSSISNVFLDAVFAALSKTNGVLHRMQPHSCLATWNIVMPCSMHAQNACHAAVQIRSALHQMQTENPVSYFDVSIGVWSGTVITGSIGTKESRASGLFGSGVRSVKQLQRYAAASGRGIVANSEVYRIISSAPRTFLLPIDIVSFQSSTVSPQVVHEVVGDLNQAGDEWMYELQSCAEHRILQTKLAALLATVKSGVLDLNAFLEELHTLQHSSEPPVQWVCSQLERLASNGLLTAPYCRVLGYHWTPDFVGTPQMEVLQVPKHRKVLEVVRVPG